MKKLLFLSSLVTLLIIGNSYYSYSQAVGISGTGAAPAPSALLDIDATGMNPKGVLIPRLTTTQRNNIASTCSCTPAEGLQIFNTTTKCFEAYVNGGWYVTSCPAACNAPTAPTANAATNPCSTSFTANWTASTGATSYYLDVSTNSSFSSFVTGYNNLNVGNVTTYSVTGLTASTTYYYQLRAATTCTSVNSSYITTATNTTTAPSAPTTATHTPSSNQIVWNWNTSAGATGYKWNTTNNYATATDNAASNSYTQTSLTPVTSYTLYAWAYNACGVSSATTLTSSTTAAASFVEDVFSAYLYTGNGSTQSITNGIDLAGQGGMLWIKDRAAAGFTDNTTHDNSRGATGYIETSSTNGAGTNGGYVSAFNANGFSIGNNYRNENNHNYVSWTFRNAPSFFTNLYLAHTSGTPNSIDLSSLGTVGMVALKSAGSGTNWIVFHRSATSGKLLYLNTTGAEAVDATLTLSGTTLTVASSLATGNYIIYAWAHDASANGIIQCGSFTSTVGALSINLGWEPQYLLYKRASGIDGWHIADRMRGFQVDRSGGTVDLQANSAGSEAAYGITGPTSTGFTHTNGSAGDIYIYMAIRKGPMRTPTAGTQVYNALNPAPTAANNRKITGVGFTPDMMFLNHRTGGGYGTVVVDKLRGMPPQLLAYSTNLEDVTQHTAGQSPASFDTDGFTEGFNDSQQWDYSAGGYTNVFHFFKRAPGFFDEVCYNGSGVGTPATVTHNLTVAPEMIITAKRATASAGVQFQVWTKDLTGNKTLYMHSTNGLPSWGAQSPTTVTATNFVSGWFSSPEATTNTFVDYLFATLPGISKVGTYTGNGGTQTIGCGFSSTARFILIKRTDAAGEWFLWDSVRGIVAGNDPHISLNSSAAEVTSDDSVDPDASGFMVNEVAATHINVTSATYIFLAID